jgi:hypothetical protein
MIAAYAFLAAFAVQILVVSVLNPARFIRYIRGWVTNFGSERIAQLYPGFDYNRWARLFATRFRAANMIIALVGVSLLWWLFTLIQHPDWGGDVIKLTISYFFLQMSPLILLGVYSVVRYRKMLLQPSQETKRKATLQRRGLFDFVSPFVVFVAVASYLLFIPFAICVDLYVYQNTSLSKYCYQAIAAVTLVYALNAFIVYKRLYGRKSPLVTHEGRTRMIAMTVKSGVYGSIATVWFIVLMSFVTKLELENWRPFAMSIFLAISTLLSLMDATTPSRKPEADGLGSSAVP